MWYAGQEGSRAKKCASVPVDCQTWIKRSRHNAKQVKVQDGVATTSSLSVELPKEKVGKEEADSVERKSCQSMYGEYLYYYIYYVLLFSFELWDIKVPRSCQFFSLHGLA